MLVLSYFVLFFPCIGVGARGWVVDTAGHGGWVHPAGVGLLAKCRVVFWAPNLHLRRMLLTGIYIICICKYIVFSFFGV